jgi:hypothetical protein
MDNNNKNKKFLNIEDIVILLILIALSVLSIGLSGIALAVAIWATIVVVSYILEKIRKRIKTKTENHDKNEKS